MRSSRCPTTSPHVTFVGKTGRNRRARGLLLTSTHCYRTIPAGSSPRISTRLNGRRTRWRTSTHVAATELRRRSNDPVPDMAATYGSPSQSRLRPEMRDSLAPCSSPRRWSDGRKSGSTRTTVSFRARTRCQPVDSATSLRCRRNGRPAIRATACLSTITYNRTTISGRSCPGSCV